MERNNGRYFWNSGVFSYAMIPRCRPNSTVFFQPRIYSLWRKTARINAWRSFKEALNEILFSQSLRLSLMFPRNVLNLGRLNRRRRRSRHETCRPRQAQQGGDERDGQPGSRFRQIQASGHRRRARLVRRRPGGVPRPRSAQRGQLVGHLPGLESALVNVLIFCQYHKSP